MRHLAKFNQRLQRYGDETFFFSKWQTVAILDLLRAFRVHHDDHLVVSIVEQNLVEFDALVSIT